MTTQTITSNGGSITLPSKTFATDFVLYGAGGGGGGSDAGYVGGPGGPGAKLSGTAINFSPGATITCYIGGAGSAGGSNGNAGNGGPGGGGSAAPGGGGGGAGPGGSSGGGGGGGGATGILIGGTYVALSGGGGGGGGAAFPNVPGLSGNTNTSVVSSAGSFATSSGGAGGSCPSDGSGGGGGGGGSPGGGGGPNGYDVSAGNVRASGGSGGQSAYNTTYVPAGSVSATTSSGASYGYGNGPATAGATGAALLTYAEITVYKIASPTVAATTSNITVTKGETVELTWATSDASTANINGTSVGAVSTQIYTKTYTPTTTTTYTFTATRSGYNAASSALTATVVDPPVIDSFTISPLNYVTTGNSVTLSWQTTNATSVSIDQGIGSVSVDGSKNYTTTTAGPITFTLTAVNSVGGTLGTTTAQVSIQVVNPPTIDSFSINPNPVNQDTTTTLSWTTTDANTVSINQGVGTGLSSDGSVDVIATVPSSGAGSFPGAPTYGNGYRIYTLTATNIANTSVTKTAQLDVIPLPPSVTLSVSPTTVNFGESSSLSWVTTYSNTGSIDQGIGTVTPIASGSKSVSISGNPNNYKSNSSITYTMSVEGYGGKTTGSTVLTVLVDSSPNSWTFNSKSAAKINTVYYSSSNSTTPL